MQLFDSMRFDSRFLGLKWLWLDMFSDHRFLSPRVTIIDPWWWVPGLPGHWKDLTNKNLQMELPSQTEGSLQDSKLYRDEDLRWKGMKWPVQTLICATVSQPIPFAGQDLEAASRKLIQRGRDKFVLCLLQDTQSEVTESKLDLSMMNQFYIWNRMMEHRIVTAEGDLYFSFVLCWIGIY